MEDTENINVSIVLDEVGNPEMPVVKNANVARGCQIAVPNLGENGEILRPVVDALNITGRSLRVICRDVFEYILEPALRFRGPRYFCHERIRRPISSFEMTRFASESASPRSTMT